jgi:hypothetical protein
MLRISERKLWKFRNAQVFPWENVMGDVLFSFILHLPPTLPHSAYTLPTTGLDVSNICHKQPRMIEFKPRFTCSFLTQFSLPV